MKRLAPGTELDGFRVGECLHAGGMAHVYAVEFAQRTPAPFPMVMKVPRMTAGDGAENIVGFEVEHQIMQTLQGRSVPRLVAAGDLSAVPYLVMEHIPGLSLQQWLDQHTEAHTRPTPQEVAQLHRELFARLAAGAEPAPVFAAASTSMARAVAPARRIGSQASRTLDDPPVTCRPSA